MTPQSSGLYAVDDVEAMAQRLEQYAPGLNAAAMLRSQAERIAALELVVAAADAMRFMPGLPSWAKDQYDAASVALNKDNTPKKERT